MERTNKFCVILSIHNLNSMIKQIKENRKDDYNGTATTGRFYLETGPSDKELLHYQGESK